jgi:predicted deacylase
VTFVPVCNPAAYEKNVRFVEKNLNRIIYHHERATACKKKHLLISFAKLIDAHDVLLDLHSYSSGQEPFLFVDKDDEVHRAYARSSPFSYWMMDWNDLYPNPGENKSTTTSYAHSKGKISMTVECGNHLYPFGGELAYDTIRATLANFGLSEPNANAKFKSSKDKTLIRMREIVMKEREGKFTQPWKFLDRVKRIKFSLFTMMAKKSKRLMMLL